MKPRVALGILISIVWSFGGCEPNGSTATSAPEVTLEDLIQPTRTIAVQENDTVLNVTPSVTFDPSGGFLVADPREDQVRRYAPSGSLLWHAGRSGDGPGEFRQPNRIVRLPDGDILVADFDRRFTLFTPRADSVIRVVDTPFTRIEDLDVLNDSLLLVSALAQRNLFGPRLHVWDFRHDSVITSFFSPFQSSPNKTAAATADWANASVHGDTIAAVFSVSDSVYFFSREGVRLAAVPLPSARFRRVPARAPDRNLDPLRRAQWFASFDYVSSVNWLSSGDLLVLYESLGPSPDLPRTWHLLLLSSSGRGIAEVEKAPLLLAVESGPERDSLLFVSTDAEVPDRWTLATLVRH